MISVLKINSAVCDLKVIGVVIVIFDATKVNHEEEGLKKRDEEEDWSGDVIKILSVILDTS